MTLSEQIIARAAGVEEVEPGQIVTCQVDLAMMHDSGGPRRIAPKLKELGADIADPDKVVLVTDHFVPATDANGAEILSFTRRFAREHGIAKFHDMQGICHIVLPEQGYLRPGMLVVGGDSHSPTGGAFGCFMVGIGATEMAGVLVTGSIWLRVPATIRVGLSGALTAGVSAKDIMLRLCRQLGMNNNYRVIEYGGAAVEAMAMSERMVLTNMAAELGAKTGLIAADETTSEALIAAGSSACEAQQVSGEYESVISIEADLLPPQIALPHSPANSTSVTAVEAVNIDQCYIGACTGAKLSDLQMAAKILRGRKVARSTRLLVAPASTRTTALAAADGTLKTLTESGAILLPTGCGACAGMGAGALAAGEVCLSSTARNFKGRMGSPDSQVYLGSPYSVAAAAITGRITDPRELLS